MRITVFDCELLAFQTIGDTDGHIVPINNGEIPFELNRVFYLYDIPTGESRGAHAHKKCHQLLIALSGAFEVYLDDGENSKIVTLNNPKIGLHIPPGIWASEGSFSSASICLVLASHVFDESDYIRNYLEYEKFLKNDRS